MRRRQVSGAELHVQMQDAGVEQMPQRYLNISCGHVTSHISKLAHFMPLGLASPPQKHQQESSR